MNNLDIENIKNIYKENFKDCTIFKCNNKEYLLLTPIHNTAFKDTEFVIEVISQRKHLNKGDLTKSVETFRNTNEFKGKSFKILSLNGYSDEVKAEVENLRETGVYFSDLSELKFLQNRINKNMPGSLKENKLDSIYDHIQYRFSLHNSATCIVDSDDIKLDIIHKLVADLYKDKNILILANKKELNSIKKSLKDTHLEKVEIKPYSKIKTYPDDALKSEKFDLIISSDIEAVSKITLNRYEKLIMSESKANRVDISTSKSASALELKDWLGIGALIILMGLI